MSRSAPVLVLLAAGALALAGCGDAPAPDPKTRPAPPAAAGLSDQRQLAAPTLRARVVARGFRRPSGLVREPGPHGRTLVLERAGTARWLDGDRPAPGPPFLDLRGTVRLGAEQGLLGLAFLPGYRRDPRVALHYTDVNGNTQVAIYRVRHGYLDPLSARTILTVEQPYANHNGGTLRVGPRGWLYLGLGDGGSAYDPRQKAQDLSSPLGKILRCRPSRGCRTWQTVAYGLRNPWRMSFDRGTGDLWLVDAGQDPNEQQTFEVDRIPAARLRQIGPSAGPATTNFGWAAYEGAREQTNRRLTPSGPLTWPIASYTERDGCSVVGGVAVRAGRGAVPPAGREPLRVLRDRYVFGDRCSGMVWSIRADGGPGAPMRREGVRVPGQTAYLRDRTGRLLVSTVGGQIVRLTGR